MEGTVLADSSEGSAFPNALSSISTLDATHGDASRTSIKPKFTYTRPSSRRSTAADTPATAERLALARAKVAEAEEVARTEAARANNAYNGQRGRSWAIPGRPPTLCWTGRSRWLALVDTLLDSDEGLDRCRRQGLSPTTARAIAHALASLADARTGRHVTASNATIAERAAKEAGRHKPWSHDVVSKVRKVLTQLGLAVEVARGRYLTKQERLEATVHHEGVQLRAASTWALLVPRRWQAKSYLVCKSPSGRFTSSRSTSPTRVRARAKAPCGRSPRPKRPPRPLAAQKVTADLVARIQSLDNGRHIGSLVDVIAELVDCNRWTARDLVTILNEDARDNPRDWPSTIKHPAGFLRHRLSRLQDVLAGPSPSEVAAAHAAKLRADQEARHREQEAAKAQAASLGTVRSSMAEFRATLAAKRANRRLRGE